MRSLQQVWSQKTTKEEKVFFRGLIYFNNLDLSYFTWCVSLGLKFSFIFCNKSFIQYVIEDTCTNCNQRRSKYNTPFYSKHYGLHFVLFKSMVKGTWSSILPIDGFLSTNFEWILGYCLLNQSQKWKHLLVRSLISSDLSNL